MPTIQKPVILVAALNWGLGHATRCIPLIWALERMGAQVVLASDGAALRLLQEEFPHLPAVSLPSYRIRYDTNSMVWNIARQLPRIAFAIRTEQWTIERLLRKYGIQGIVSDNRYGCFSPHVPSVLLTHQIHLRVPNAALQWASNQVLRRVFRKFDKIWIPDDPTEPSLSGELSHPPLPGFDQQYLGLLSRFSGTFREGIKLNNEPDQLDSVKKVAVVLSGPEPQRTYLERILLEQALVLPQRFTFIKGKMQHKEHHFMGENVEVISYLTSRDLQELLQGCDVVICRAGYSSLMDLVALGKKRAILIPTPGQTEQEFLGEWFARQGVFICQKQENVHLETGLRDVRGFNGLSDHPFGRTSFEPILENWLKTLVHHKSPA